MRDDKPRGFQPVENNVSFPQQEESILDFWRKHEIYRKSLQQRSGNSNYVFYEGPPTANGKPHPGHCLTRAIKDLFPSLQDHARILLRTQGGLGYARIAGRSGSLQRTGNSLKRGNRQFRR